jgi:hypothetical protein
MCPQHPLPTAEVVTRAVVVAALQRHHRLQHAGLVWVEFQEHRDLGDVRRIELAAALEHVAEGPQLDAGVAGELALAHAAALQAGQRVAQPGGHAAGFEDVGELHLGLRGSGLPPCGGST